MEQDSLQSLYTLLLVIAGALLLTSATCTALALRPTPAARRQWVWRTTDVPGASSWATRGIAVAAALTAVGTWALLPMREELASITPMRVTLVTSALVLLCVSVAITALTRRSPATPPASKPRKRMLVSP
jgi:hypothetical protein